MQKSSSKDNGKNYQDIFKLVYECIEKINSTGQYSPLFWRITSEDYYKQENTNNYEIKIIDNLKQFILDNFTVIHTEKLKETEEIEKNFLLLVENKYKIVYLKYLLLLFTASKNELIYEVDFHFYALKLTTIFGTFNTKYLIEYIKQNATENQHNLLLKAVDRIILPYSLNEFFNLENPQCKEKIIFKIHEIISIDFIKIIFSLNNRRGYLLDNNYIKYFLPHAAKLFKEVFEQYGQRYFANSERNYSINEDLNIKKDVNLIEKKVLDIIVTTGKYRLIEQGKNLAIESKYRQFARNKKAALLFIDYDITEAVFDKYLELKPKDTDKYIPDITIEGSDLGQELEAYYLIKLSNMALAAIAGNIFGCCQHLGGLAASSVIFGIEQENGGFYVLMEYASQENRCKKIKTTRDKMVACGLAWININSDDVEEKKILVIDSIETHANLLLLPEKIICIRRFFAYLASKLIQYKHIDRVHLGGRVQKLCFGHYANKKANVPKINGKLLEISEQTQPIYSDYINACLGSFVEIANKKFPLLNKILYAKDYTLEPKDWVELRNDNLEKIEPLFNAAAQYDHLNVVKQLLEFQGNAPGRCICDLVDSDALLSASENGNLRIVRYLTENTASNPADLDNYAIRLAAINGHLDVVRYFAELVTFEHGRVVSVCNPTARQNYALIGAAENGHDNVVQFLLELRDHCGNLVCDPTAQGNKAIEFAAINGHLSVVKCLADVKNESGECICDLNIAFNAALSHGHFHIVTYLATYPIYNFNVSLVNNAILKNSYELIKFFLTFKDESGHYIYNPAMDGNKALFNAVKFGSNQQVRNLLLADKRVYFEKIPELVLTKYNQEVCGYLQIILKSLVDADDKESFLHILESNRELMLTNLIVLCESYDIKLDHLAKILEVVNDVELKIILHGKSSSLADGSEGKPKPSTLTS